MASPRDERHQRDQVEGRARATARPSVGVARRRSASPLASAGATHPRTTSTLPAFRSALPRFHLCDACGSLVVTVAPAPPGGSDGGWTPPSCCQAPMRELVPGVPDGSPSGIEALHRPVMTITGGFERNAVTVRVGADPCRPHPMAPNHRIAWIWLRTFEGGHLKYLEPGREPEVTFALSGDDGFGYCDRPICKMGREHCLFQCKRGYAAYAYCTVHGLWTFRF